MALGRPDRAVDPDHAFRAHRLRLGEGRGTRIEHALGHAVMVAQVDEQQAAVVADAVAPTGEAHGLADQGKPDGSTGVRAVSMHENVCLFGQVQRKAP